MTSNEILKADVLDIVFDNRNKNYGAYLLRKNYNNRLVIALGGMLGFVLVLVVLVNLNPRVGQVISNIINRGDTVTLSAVEFPPPQPPAVAPPPRLNVRQINNSRFEIVDQPTTVPTQTSIEGAAISNINVDGIDVNETPSVLPIGTVVEQSIVETAPPPPPAPSTAAEFPGGQKKWMEFLNRHLRTPAELETGQKKNVLVRFAVGEDGTVTQFEIVQSGGTSFDNEVIRVLKKMPKWKPAVQNGRNVSVMFTQPVTFVAFEE
jgi:protein TonB